MTIFTDGSWVSSLNMIGGGAFSMIKMGDGYLDLRVLLGRECFSCIAPCNLHRHSSCLEFRVQRCSLLLELFGGFSS